MKPRARSLLLCRRGVHGPLSGWRFIPACAGNTPTTGPRADIPSVHPRLRGEHQFKARTCDAPDGSSPPARGTHKEIKNNIEQTRFIPACAGNTFPAASSPRPRAVHPRLRGEHKISSEVSIAPSGSSPPARGTHPGAPAKSFQGRFIPACAGNTADNLVDLGHAAVHPRLRGEHESARPRRLSKFGSSPPARGTPAVNIVRDETTRFIPACAGNTWAIRQRDGPRAVHPRLRGEHPILRLWALSRTGSSPPARGTQVRDTVVSRPPRFIPACAGNTSVPRNPNVTVAVHPRLRGEHPECLAGQSRADGSSPPARGTLAALTATSYKYRFIPACAGNTRTAQQGRCGETVHPRLRGEHRSRKRRQP